MVETNQRAIFVFGWGARQVCSRHGLRQKMCSLSGGGAQWLKIFAVKQQRGHFVVTHGNGQPHQPHIPAECGGDFLANLQLARVK